MNKKLLVLGVLFFAFLIVFFEFPVITFADTNNNVTLDVNVTASASIIIIPNYLNWTGVQTGTAAGYKNLTVKNAGSVNVSQVYAYIDTLIDEASRPYGSDNPASFAAGSVITIRNETDSKYYFVGRIEWNWTQDIPNHDWSAVTSPKSWGYFRNASNDYVWVLGNGTGGRCNESGAQFSIETNIDLGPIETRTPDNTFSITASAGDPNQWGYTSVTSGPLIYQCVAAYYDCSKIYIYNFDKRSNFTGCTGSDYMFTGNLTPGQTFMPRVDAWVPNGIPSGNLTTATLTFYATSTP